MTQTHAAQPSPDTSHRSRPGRPAPRHGFTLIELLVVISIIALLIGILLPVLGSVRQTAKSVQCLSNLRQLSTAHYMYLNENDGYFVNVGLAHGGAHADEDATWVKTLRDFWADQQDSGLGDEVRARSPLDESPHWGPAPAGDPIPASPPDQRRRTSYGLNDMLTEIGPGTRRVVSIDQAPRPTATVHIVTMAYTGSFAGADHVHGMQWLASGDNATGIAAEAAFQIQNNSVSGEAGTVDAVSNYGFLDGHAAAHRMDDVFASLTDNKMIPAEAR
ncbi:MAG: prepilin-type N-terminal cleavage/methylation domain-containing protein [Planctomycetes bacterium]|jgi:prepilin-type N-terminal cleavage/methylation domain-containing protein/prepilin-type processing-associated H-X9-DG protein|nr:prepilin-type N-terminal cleavage/methylation domain-containing protein [Planctomycetota bacterium]